MKFFFERHVNTNEPNDRISVCNTEKSEDLNITASDLSKRHHVLKKIHSPDVNKQQRHYK